LKTGKGPWPNRARTSRLTPAPAVFPHTSSSRYSSSYLLTLPSSDVRPPKQRAFPRTSAARG
jgi:hypothetical protein